MYFAQNLNIYESLIIFLIGILLSVILNKKIGYYKIGFNPLKHSFFENFLFLIQFLFIMWGATALLEEIFQYFGIK